MRIGRVSICHGAPPTEIEVKDAVAFFMVGSRSHLTQTMRGQSFRRDVQQYSNLLKILLPVELLEVFCKCICFDGNRRIHPQVGGKAVM
jgi:hypothetical protein